MAKYLKQTYRKSASKLHRRVGDILRSNSLTMNYRIYQEFPLSNPKYHVDFFIQDLNLCIEVHGQQHVKPVAFNGDKQQADLNFITQVDRDNIKTGLIKQAGYTLIEIYYDELKDDSILINRIFEVLYGKLRQ